MAPTPPRNTSTRVHVVSDVHGNARDLARAGEGADALICLGDLVLFLDYADHSRGIFPDLFGVANADRIVELRTAAASPRHGRSGTRVWGRGRRGPAGADRAGGAQAVRRTVRRLPHPDVRHLRQRRRAPAVARVRRPRHHRARRGAGGDRRPCLRLRLDPEDLTPLPGAEDLALLRALREAALAEAHDLLVVDLPPAPRALALLAAPEELRRCLGRLLPPERQAARALRPVLGRLAGVPMPTEALYEAASRWDLELAAAEAVLADRNTVVRLVAEPGPAGADAVRATALGLALRGLRTDCLVANRVLPEDTPADSWLSGPLAQQRKTLEEWRGPTTSAPSPISAATRAARTTWPPSTCRASTRTPPRSSGPSPTGWPRTACWSGTSRCPEPCARSST
ncbi:hypothetical protein SVIOM342S_04482 [Streptomyces violaceorubidus]